MRKKETVTHKILTYLGKRKSAASAMEVTRGIQGNPNTVRRELGELTQGVWEQVTKSYGRYKCPISGAMVHKYSR